MLTALPVLWAWGAPLLSQTRPTTTTAPAAAEAPSNRRAVIIRLEGEINEFTRGSVMNRVEEARRLGAGTVILRIHTPGGMVGPAMEMSRFIKQQEELQVIAFVDEYAYSAGALISLACDAIYMEGGSYIGDCAPIIPGEKLEGAERAKAEGPILAEFRDSAQRNGYDPLLAESMVQYGKVVHYVVNDAGERRFVDAATYEKLTAEGWKPVEGLRNPIDGPEELLTINADEAGKLGLSRGQFRSPEALAEALGLEVIATLQPGSGEQVVAFLNNSAVRGLLGTVFMLALLAAFYTPGHGAPEAIAVGALALMLGAPLMTGYATWYEIVAILLGVILLAVELFVIPGFGVTGLTGIILIFGGIVMTFVPREPVEIPGILPSLPQTTSAIQQGLLITSGGLLCSLLLWVWLQRYLPKMPYFNRLILTTTSGGSSPSVADTGPGEAVSEAVWPAVGALGRAMTDLRPGGTAAFPDPLLNDTRSIDVISDLGFVRAQTPVVVREASRNKIVVRPAT